MMETKTSKQQKTKTLNTADVSSSILINTGSIKIIFPLEMIWQPKEDITTYELAICLPYFFRRDVMPYEVDTSLPHFRHFKIIDHNVK